MLQALKDCQDRLKQHEGQLKTALKDHADLFKSEAVATELLASSFKGAQEMLEELHAAGEIPKITVPILQECLTTGICICGESLAPGKRDNSQRRQHIEGLIAANVASDEIREILTGLYYQLRPLPDAGRLSRAWLARQIPGNPEEPGRHQRNARTGQPGTQGHRAEIGGSARC